VGERRSKLDKGVGENHHKGLPSEIREVREQGSPEDLRAGTYESVASR